MKYLFSLLVGLLASQLLLGQCLVNVDLNTWSVAGNPASGNWVVQGGGSEVRQTTNGSETFFVSPFDLINVRVSGRFRTTDNDDDWMGFVFGFRDPIGNTNDFDTWLFDWKHSAQNAAPEGKTLAYAFGNIPPGSRGNYFGDHNAGPEFNIVGTDWGGAAGWNRNTWHNFELIYTFTRAQIFIDGNLVFDHTDCFKPGRFGFYNRSQEDVYYGNFSYLLDIDFSVPAAGTCTGIPVPLTFVDACAASNYDPNVYQTFEWCYGDGTCETLTTPSLADVNPTHTYAAPGNYNIQLTVTDINGCTDVATHTVTITPPPTAAFTTSDPCTSGGTVFTDNSSGNSPINAWAWDYGDGGTDAVQNPPAHNYANPGTFPVELIVTDSDGCMDTVTQNIDVLSTFVASSTVIDESCPGNSDGEVDLTIALGSPPYTYSWSNTDVTEDIQGLTAGPYTVTFTDINGCTGTHTATVGLLPPIDITLTPFEYVGGVNLSCMDANDGRINPIVTGGTFPYQFSWSSGDNTQSVQGLAAGPYDLTITDAKGCTAVESVTLTEPDELIGTITPNTYIGGVNISCAGESDGSVDLSVVGGTSDYSYSWDGGTQTIEDATGLNAGPHTVLITDANGCIAIADVTLTEPAPLEANVINSVEPTCFDGSDGTALAEGNGGTGPNYTFDWSSTDMAAQAELLSAGTYTVTVTDENGCTATEDVTLGQPEPIQITFDPVDTILFGNTAELVSYVEANGNAIESYFWDPPFSVSCDTCPNTTASNVFTLEYTLYVIDELGCEGSGTVTVTVNNDKVFYVPSAFTPNGDGLNDIFQVYAEGVDRVSAKIYDRWGEKVYEITDIDDGWSGEFKGKFALPGVYLYQVEVEYLDGEEMRKNGSLTLIR